MIRAISLDGKYYEKEHAMDALVQLLTRSGTLQAHPDMSMQENAKTLLAGLLNTGVLSDKTTAILKYDHGVRMLMHGTEAIEKHMDDAHDKS